jgi:hypothetical protein
MGGSKLEPIGQTIARDLLQRKKLFFDGLPSILGYLAGRFVAVRIRLN